MKISDTLKERLQLGSLTWGIYFIGLLVMSFGIALMIKANLGAAPWDVLHLGLYKHFGLTVGTWSILIGILIVGMTCLLTREWPRLGAVFNMILVGVFIDFDLSHLHTPGWLLNRFMMLILGILVNGVGMSIYISAHKGAGPRDSLMLYLVKQTGMKLTHIRRMMEIGVLAVGWLLGGPVSIGTLMFGLTIGSIVGRCLPICESYTNKWTVRREWDEDFNQGEIRAYDYDGAGEALREGTARIKGNREGA